MIGKVRGTGRESGAPAAAVRSHAYAQARRHSGRVRFLKRAIPIGSCAAIGLLLGFTLFNPFGRVEGLSLGPISLSGTKITMEQPRLTGFQKDTRPYEVTATEAAQDVRKPNLVELKALRARIVVDDAGTVARLEAASGLFDTQKEHLELREDVRVRSDSGYDAQLRSASIDFKAGTVASREPVRVGVSNGVIEADRLDILDNGKTITFTGRVRSTFASPQIAPSEAQPVRTSDASPERP